MPPDPTHVRSPRDLGLVVRERRRSLGLSQQELADRVGVSRPWVVHLEQGKARAEVGLVLRTLRALGLGLHLVPEEDASDAVGNHPGSAQTAAPGPEIDIDAIVDAAKGGRRS